MEYLLLFSVGVSATLLLYAICFSVKLSPGSRGVDDGVFGNGFSVKKEFRPPAFG